MQTLVIPVLQSRSAGGYHLNAKIGYYMRYDSMKMI